MQQGPGWRALSMVPGRFVALMLAVFCWLSPLQVFAQADAPVTLTLRGDETPEAVRRLIDALSAGGRKIEIRVGGADAPAATAVPAAAPTVPAAAAKPPPAMAEASAAEERLESLWNYFVAGFDYGNAAIPRVADLPGDWRRGWAQNRNGVTGPSAGMRILGSLAIALALAALFRFATAGWFAHRLQPEGPEFTPRLIAASYGLLQDLATIFIALGTLRLLRMLWLPEADFAEAALRTISNGAAIGGAYLMVGRFLLAPNAPERRLLPLPRAPWHFRLLTIYAIVTPVVITTGLLSQRVASGPEPVAGFLALAAMLITPFKLWWWFNARHDVTALVLSNRQVPGPGLRLLAALTPWIYMLFAIVIWMVGRASAMMADGARWAEAAGQTQIIVVLGPILAVGVTSLLACRQAHAAAQGEQTPLSQALGHALRAAAGGVIWAGGLYLLARLWASFFLGVSSGEFASFMRQAGGVAVLVFAGWVAIVFLRAFFDAFSPRKTAIGPADEDAIAADHVPSRLATVLPVLRGVVLTAVFGLTGLVLLSRLGVDIGPLLAAFGIFGLAISFGSQALVRDIVSGFFFMLEDAFRVGEYVDTGRLKGTVEKISLRSMQLRHQSGQVHTVPFGQVQSLTNASRDWATVKFNVRLDHSADIEKARKTIKKIGAALLEDPEFGVHFIAPLKMQGVADITDQAIVIRLKFTGKPNHASMLQREALKRVYRGLIEAEVPFASNAVTVREGGGKSGAAAIAAVPPPTPLVPAAE